MNIMEEGFSYHTLHMKKKINYDEYMHIRETLYSIRDIYPGSIYPTVGSPIISEQFCNCGVVVKLKKNPNKPSYLVLRINPRFLIGKHEYEGIFPCSDVNINTVQVEINNILNLIGANFSFEDMTISRIDLSVNIDTCDMDITDAYMRMFKKCLIPYNYIRIKYDKKNENYKGKNSNSFRASSRSSTLSIYDKKYQMEDQDLHEAIEYQDKEVLRIEVELNRDAIYEITHLDSYNEKPSTNMELLAFMGKYSKYTKTSHIDFGSITNFVG